MKKCSRCQSVYDDAMSFCPECGSLDYEEELEEAEALEADELEDDEAWENDDDTAAPTPSTPSASGAQTSSGGSANNGCGCLGWFIIFCVALWILDEIFHLF